MATITRIFEFDSAHRVMNEKVKCFNLHGHRFKVEVAFSYLDVKQLGYAIDFKEVKRICGGFIDEKLDHACILNPLDKELIELCKKNNWRLWLMGFGKQEDINPSAENIVGELFAIMKSFFSFKEHGIMIESIRLYETPNCWVDCHGEVNMSGMEVTPEILEWRKSMGDINYDIRNV